MQVNLNQAEIESAIKLYIGEQGIDLYGKAIEISFTAGRGSNRLTAEVDIQFSAQEFEALGRAYYEEKDPRVVEPEQAEEAECTDAVKAEVPAKTAASLFG